MGGLAAGPPSPPDARRAPAKPWRSSKSVEAFLADREPHRGVCEEFSLRAYDVNSQSRIRACSSRG